MSGSIKEQPSGWHDLGVITGLISLATFLRLTNFLGILRGDDTAYYLLAHQLANGNMLPTYWGGQNRPGLYYPASLLIRVFGSSEFVAVLFPLVASVLTLGFIYGIGRFIADRKTAEISALLWAVFPLDVFLATQLMPDGPAVMTQTGAVFFLLLALRARRRTIGLVSLALCAFFVSWSLEIKESSLIVVFPIIAITLFEFFPKIKHGAIKLFEHARARLLSALLLVMVVAAIVIVALAQPWPLVANNLELTSFDVSSLWLLGRSNPVQIEDVGTGYWVVDRPVLEIPDQLQALTVPTVSGRIRVFDIFIPIVLVSSFYGLLYKRKEFYIALLWFFVLLFYLEWGTFTQTLYFPAVLIYLPVTHWIDPRNLHILSPAMILITGLFLARLFRSSRTFYVVLASGAMLAALTALVVSNSIGLAQRILEPALLLSISGAVVLVFCASRSRTTNGSQAMASGFLLVMMAASQLPIPHFHVSDYFKEQARRTNLRDVLTFLDSHPQLPISAEGAAGWLDVYSDFELGFDHLEQGLPSSRIVKDPARLLETGGYRLLYGCNQPVASFTNWPLHEFGEDLGEKTCVSLVRVFVSETLAAELQELGEAALKDTSDDKIALYLSAAMQARDMAQASSALALFATHHFEETPIIQASALFIKEAPEQLDATATDLFAGYMACAPNCNWELSRLLTPEITTDGQPYLSISIDRKTEDVQTIELPVTLESATAYILRLELRSFAPFDLVRFRDVVIPDSYPDGWDRVTDWATFDIVFVTPIWAEERRDVMLELARVFDRGEIEFRKIELVELRSAGE